MKFNALNSQTHPLSRRQLSKKVYVLGEKVRVKFEDNRVKTCAKFLFLDISLSTHLREGIDLPLTRFDDSSRDKFDVERERCSSPVSRLR